MKKAKKPEKTEKIDGEEVFGKRYPWGNSGTAFIMRSTLPGRPWLRFGLKNWDRPEDGYEFRSAYKTLREAQDKTQ